MPRAKTKRKVADCLDCGRNRHISARGLCNTCYNRNMYHGTLDKFPVTRRLDKGRKCAHVYADGRQCREPRMYNPKTGHFWSPYCLHHHRRNKFGDDMDRPKATSTPSHVTRCQYVDPDGRQCGETRLKKKNGNWQSPYCRLHSSRHWMHRPMHLPRGMAGHHDRLLR